uniref:Ribosomal protein L5 n=1 Tax=Heterorhabditis bacteriophora TaxID=37862 RepID=A0A1I7WAI1_HETBA
MLLKLGVGLKGVIFQDCVVKLSKNMNFIKFSDFSDWRKQQKLKSGIRLKKKLNNQYETIIGNRGPRIKIHTRWHHHLLPLGHNNSVYIQIKKVTNWMRDSKWIIVEHDFEENSTFSCSLSWQICLLWLKVNFMSHYYSKYIFKTYFDEKTFVSEIGTFDRKFNAEYNFKNFHFKISYERESKKIALDCSRLLSWQFMLLATRPHCRSQDQV